MGQATPAQFRTAFEKTAEVLDGAGVDWLLIGGLAKAIYLERDWDPAEDIDVLVRERDAQRLLPAFADAGFAVDRYDERWLFKAARPNMTVDLMFRAGERVPLDDEHLSRAVDARFEGVPVRLPAPGDLVVMMAVFDSVQRPKNWHACVELLARGDVDWDHLVRRGREDAPARMLSLLLYARTDGVDVPGAAVAALAGPALGDAAARG